jgi:peptidoglycan/LPS O-acetylase OafA/YrhL
MVSLLFLVGALLCDLRHRLMPNIPRHLDLVAAFLFFSGLLFTPEFLNGFPSAFLIVIGLLILGLSGANGLVSRLLATRLVVFLGVISYSIYLSHGIVQRVLKVALPTEQFANAPLYVRTGVWLTYLAAVLLAAIALYYVVEHPARLWLRRRFAQRERNVHSN